MNNRGNVLYVNLVPIIIGGGLQNAINFLLNLDINDLNNQNIVVIIRNNDILIEICKDRNFSYKVINNNFISRLSFELFYFINKKKSVIFTLFGTKPILSWNTKTITGCAYSNLFYPNIDFWSHLRGIKKIIKQLKDIYRYKNVKSSDVVIFETELLREKAINTFSFPEKNTYTVKMAVSSTVQKGEKFIDYNICKNNFNILYLGSAHPNKRQHLLPHIVKNMLNNGLKDFKFLLTMDETNPYAIEVINSIKKMQLESYIENLGPIPNTNIANLIEQCSAMINIAKLESFSNNFVEAWQMKKVLFVTDDEWAHDSCGNAAVYLDVDDSDTLVKKINSIMKHTSNYHQVITNGINQLNTYPNAIDKISLFIDIINQNTEKY